MPQVTVKTEYIDKLKQLLVYNTWFSNVKKWRKNPTHLSSFMQNSPNFSRFIGSSFNWTDTPEGYKFWESVARRV